MCGIIGMIGQNDVALPILEGLKRLEYRGYDSAGIATLTNGAIDRRRAQGKLIALSALLQEQPLSGTIGIGHTRWATHGPANTDNAHPHITDKVAVVHNGIIENFQDLKSMLEGEGAVFTSDTDTEVIAHLFTHNLGRFDDIKAAAQESFTALQGAYALAILIKGEEDKIIIARRGSPLAIGYGEGEMFLGSDSFSLAPYTQKISYLEDGDWAILTRDKAHIFDAQNINIERPIIQLDHSAGLVDKGNYRHFMAKEIHEQGDILTHSFHQYIDPARGQTVMPHNMPDLSGIERVLFIGCGTAYFAGMVGQNWLEQYAQIPANIDLASEFRYRHAPVEKNCLAVFISQSGETADTLAAMRHCKEHGILTMGVVNVPDSSLAREADILLPTYAGVEIGVASTKALLAQLAALACFALHMARVKNRFAEGEEQKLVAALSQTPLIVHDILKHSEAHIQEIAAGFIHYNSALFIGRKTSFPLALEGALKLKELSYIHAEGFAAGELKHGSIALVDDELPIIVIAPQDDVFVKTISGMHEVIARKGKVILLSTRTGIAQAGTDCAATIELPDCDDFVSPLLYLIPLQLLAYHAACAKGTDVDQPRNLAKSVTVE